MALHLASSAHSHSPVLFLAHQALAAVSSVTRHLTINPLSAPLGLELFKAKDLSLLYLYLKP